MLTATGVVTGFGSGEQALWDGLISNRTCVAPTSAFLDGAAPVARVPDGLLAPEVERTWSMLHLAAQQILAAAPWSRVRALAPRRVGVCVGTTQGPIEQWTHDQRLLATRPGHRPALPGLAGPVHHLARMLDVTGPLACPSMACASGTAAIGLAADWLRHDRCDAVVAGGVDALSELVHAGFHRLRALDPRVPRPFDARRAGLALGEGAGLVLLEADVDDGVQLTGRGLSSDANHLTGPDPTGSGVVRAIRAALGRAGLAAGAVDVVSAHGTATVFNDLMEAKAFLQLFGDERGRTVPVSSIKGAIGHTMGAAGALEAVLCARVLREGRLPPTAGLEQQDPQIPLNVTQGRPLHAAFRVAVSTSSGFGGVNACLVFAIAGEGDDVGVLTPGR